MPGEYISTANRTCHDSRNPYQLLTGRWRQAMLMAGRHYLYLRCMEKGNQKQHTGKALQAPAVEGLSPSAQAPAGPR